jgi:hypothetical protein
MKHRHSCADECPICLEQFLRVDREVVALGCRHAICSLCYSHVKSETGEVVCPLCLSRSVFNETISSELSTFYFVDRPKKCKAAAKTLANVLEDIVSGCDDVSAAPMIAVLNIIKQCETERTNQCRCALSCVVAELPATTHISHRSRATIARRCRVMIEVCEKAPCLLKNCTMLVEMQRWCHIFIGQFLENSLVTVLVLPYGVWKNTSVRGSITGEYGNILPPDNVWQAMTLFASAHESNERSRKIKFSPKNDSVIVGYQAGGFPREGCMDGEEAALLLYVYNEDGVPLYPLLNGTSLSYHMCIRRMISKGWLHLRRKFNGPMLYTTDAFDVLGNPIEMVEPTSSLPEFSVDSGYCRFNTMPAVIKCLKTMNHVDSITAETISYSTDIPIPDVVQILNRLCAISCAVKRRLKNGTISYEYNH